MPKTHTNRVWKTWVQVVHTRGIDGVQVTGLTHRENQKSESLSTTIQLVPRLHTKCTHGHPQAKTTINRSILKLSPLSTEPINSYNEVYLPKKEY
ncbi:MAG: hypothetical protein JWL85_886 [Candidatus Saccharibacteria bacterium]|nr:hypothetical protein [Candidatus Saccharibacteria bacterium]